MVKESSDKQYRSYNTEENRDHNVPKSVILGEELSHVLIEKKESESYIPEWIEEGKKFIWPELWGQWKEEVEYFAKGIHNGAEIMQTLYILKKLEKGGNCLALNKELKDSYNEEESLMALTDTRRLILLFAKRGVEFAKELQNIYEYTDSDSKEEDSKFIKKIEERNKKMGKNQELLNVLDGGNKTK